MNWDTFARILNDVGENWQAVRVVVLYHGGEPLLNKEFSRMVREIKARGVVNVKTVSNGMLLTSERSVEIINSGLDAIEFSLDGASLEQNDFIRKNCDGRKVLRSIKNLIEQKKRLAQLKPEIYIATTQFKKSEIDFSEMPDDPPFIAEFLKENQADISGVKSTFAMRWPDLTVDPEIYRIITNPAEKTVEECDHVNSTITIRWNGDVVPCCYDLGSSLVLGNIYEESIVSIWNGQRFKSLRQSITEKRFKQPCSRCNVVNQDDYLIPRARQMR
jgi:radical SAM protein with 4Fe4S-binding SPASM domain